MLKSKYQIVYNGTGLLFQNERNASMEMFDLCLWIFSGVLTGFLIKNTGRRVWIIGCGYFLKCASINMGKYMQGLRMFLTISIIIFKLQDN